MYSIQIKRLNHLSGQYYFTSLKFLKVLGLKIVFIFHTQPYMSKLINSDVLQDIFRILDLAVSRPVKSERILISLGNGSNFNSFSCFSISISCRGAYSNFNCCRISSALLVLRFDRERINLRLIQAHPITSQTKRLLPHFCRAALLRIDGELGMRSLSISGRRADHSDLSGA